ncbi:hypothetical protein CASFOL_000826 [Castilleja foliolosa]|uniref:Uncharacterized protein n=1 Tax=Castilleja foliolosa TaxID=1961234 RepID=A0ABD3ELB8_9LAMI
MAPYPFKVLADERELYRSLKKRNVAAPLVVDVPAWTDGTGEFKRRIDRMITDARLENWVRYREKAYAKLMLEFYTSLCVSGSTLYCRIGGVDKVFTPQRITEIFGFDTIPLDELPFDHPESYNQFTFWDDIKVPGVNKGKHYPFTCVKDNELYFIYRLITMCLLGKGEPTNITQPELKLLHALKTGRNIRLWPLILSNLQRVGEVRQGKNSKLTHGTFITVLAKHAEWEPTLAEDLAGYDPVEMTFGLRQVRNPDRPESRGEWVDICKIIEYAPRPDPIEPFAQDDDDAPEAEGDDADDDQPPTDADEAGPSRPRKRPSRAEMNVPTDFWIDWEGWKLQNTQEHKWIGEEFVRQDVTIDRTYQVTRRINTRLDVHETRQLEILASHARLTTRLDQIDAQGAQILAGQEEQRRRDEQNESARQRAEQRAEERADARAQQMMEQFARRFDPHFGGPDDPPPPLF